MDKNLSKLISEEIALAAMFYFEQVFAFCLLINKNVLEWFLLIICEEHTHLQTILVENIPHCVFNYKRRSPDAQ